MNMLATEVREHWATIEPVLTIQDEQNYDRAVATLNELLDEVGTNYQHPLYGLLDTLGTIIAAYEAEHVALLNFAIYVGLGQSIGWFLLSQSFDEVGQALVKGFLTHSSSTWC